MSELIQANDKRATIRWKLLTGASVLALTGYISSAGVTRAEDSDRPPLWIEFGGQMELLQGTTSPFIAPFMIKTPTPGPFQGDILIKGQKPSRLASGFDGKISFQPDNSDWIFSAAIRYGRSHANGHIHHQSPVSPQLYPHDAAAYADITALHNEDHAIVDFTAGKDIGLGALGHNGVSTISVGIRFAQFSAKSNVDVHARPSVVPVSSYRFGRTIHYPSFNGYSMIAHAQRKFHGVGPSLSWDGSAELSGNRQDGELTLDWGINGAVLFGRQRTKLNHTTYAYHLPGSYYGYYYAHSLYRHPHPVNRSRSVMVPNVGGFAGISLKWPNAKVSIGYRADVFFGAMDTGIDAAKKSNVTFNGPYASISIGLGD